MQSSYPKATFGGGCFWCLEAVYQEVAGIREVVSGYAGGHTANPTYREICGGSTGHAEVVQITFDPEEITYRELLEIFFVIHDPTQRNRQGNDVGPQYRSIILYHDDEQKVEAQKVMDEVNTSGAYEDSIVTELKPLESFYVAEDKHQDYYQNNAWQPYCQVVIKPKLRKFRETFSSKRKAA